MDDRDERRGRRTLRVYEVKRGDPAGLCRLAENGVPCARPAKVRGLCRLHYRRLLFEHTVEQYALRPVGMKMLRKSYRVKASPDPRVCRLIADGVPCERPASTRGLCRGHYMAVRQRGDLDIALFALPPKRTLSLRKRRTLADGECRVEEGGAPCREPAARRGLCMTHYLRFLSGRRELLDSIGLPPRGSARITLRNRIVPGRCRAATDGEGCPEVVFTRGLCRHHYGALRGDPALMKSIALPARVAARFNFERRADAGADPGVCVVIENGVPCVRPPQYRGVCSRHLWRIRRQPGSNLQAFYLPKRTAVLRRKDPGRPADGLCLIEEDDRPCARPPHVRGLCRIHYRRVGRLHRLDELALPPRTNSVVPFGPANDRPHVYLDKNVLFDHADEEVFGACGQSASVALVRAAKEGAIRATVSLDAVKSTYNHVRHRLVRPPEEGGRGLVEEEAERIARTYVLETLLSEGAYRIVSIGIEDLRQVAREPGGLSLEDAMEFRAYRLARSGKAAPTMFVTRDRGIPEGVPPSKVMEELREAGLLDPRRAHRGPEGSR